MGPSLEASEDKEKTIVDPCYSLFHETGFSSIDLISETLTIEKSQN